EREQRFQSTDELLEALRAGRESRRIAPEAPTVITSGAAAAAHLTPPAGSKAPPAHGAALTPTPPPLTTPTPDASATTLAPSTPPPGGGATPPPKSGGDDMSRTRARGADEIAMPQRQGSRANVPMLLAGAFAITIVIGLGGFFLVMRARRTEEARP